MTWVDEVKDGHAKRRLRAVQREIKSARVTAEKRKATRAKRCQERNEWPPGPGKRTESGRKWRVYAYALLRKSDEGQWGDRTREIKEVERACVDECLQRTQNVKREIFGGENLAEVREMDVEILIQELDLELLN